MREKINEIKGRFRLMMNGVAARSMREKGLGYKQNRGIGLPSLKAMAAEYGKDYGLAVELWKENVRECKILATFIMPADKMPQDLVELWVEEIPNIEIADIASLNLFRRVDGAQGLAFKWISSDKETVQLCGYRVITWLLADGCELTEREINEYIDQAQTALNEGSIPLRHAILNSLSRFGEMGPMHAAILKSAFKELEF